MRTPAQRLGQAVCRAAGVLVVGALLMQHVPVGPLAQQWTSHANGGCTEQVCYCGADCTCAHCDQHGGKEGSNAPSESAGEQPDPSDELAFRSCDGSSQGPAGVFVVSKSLVAPGPLPMTTALRAEALAPSRPPAALVSQRRGDDVFRPPKPRIG